MARRWCAECHLIDSEPAATVIDGAPPFATIANDPAKGGTYLRTWLFDPHPPMPALELTRREIENVVTYIESLRAK
jgi:mono/diheme cytochrome c family protein